MGNTKYGKRREGRWTPIRAKAQDTRANPDGWETHLVKKRWDIGLLRALSPRIMMMMMMMMIMMMMMMMMMIMMIENFMPPRTVNVQLALQHNTGQYFDQTHLLY